MTETNGNAPFTHNDKKSGDVIRSEDWNAAMNEVMRLDTAKVNRQGTDTIQGPLTIEKALTLNGKVGIGGEPGTGAEKLQVTGSAAIDSLSVSKTLKVTEASTLTGNVGIGVAPATSANAEKLQVKGSAAIDSLSVSKTLTVTKTSTLTGNVGIGVAPATGDNAEKLQVKGSAAIAGDLSITGASNKLTVAGTSTLTGKIGIGGEPSTEQLKVSGDAAITGNLSITGQVYIDNHSQTEASVDSFKIFVSASGNSGTRTSPPIVRINNHRINFTLPRRGLNTIILNSDKVKKTEHHQDVYDNPANWNTWADWINNHVNATYGDLVITASMDAVRNAPSESTSSANKLLKSINSTQAFRLERGPTSGSELGRPSDLIFKYRTAYILIFVKGQNKCHEVATQHKPSSSRAAEVSVSLDYNSDIVREFIRKNLYAPIITHPTSEGGSLRLVRGTVRENGEIRLGKDFSVVKEGEGKYIINFTPAFLHAPTVVVTQHYRKDGWGGDTKDNCVVTFTSENEAHVICGNSSGNKTDRSFEFIAVG